MVNINGDDWRVLIVPPGHPSLQRPDGSFTIGCCDNEIKTIYVARGLTETYFKRVLCHELVHACMCSYNVVLNNWQEEVLADLMATYGQEIISIANSMFKRLADCRNGNKGYSC